MYRNMRVTKGFVISELLTNYKSFVRDTEKLIRAVSESDIKEEGGGIAVNLNITSDANEKLEELKSLLDNGTGRSLFPAQILDILLICSLNNDEQNTEEIQISNKELAKALMDYVYKILTEEAPSINVINAKFGLIKVLSENRLL
jgi:hypothetical protein